MLNYALGNFLIKFKNAAMAKNKTFEDRPTKLISAVALSLKKHGYLEEIKKEKNTTVFSLAFRHKRPVLTDLKLVSKPGLRIYTDIRELGKRRKPSMLIVSTPKGILGSREAVKAGVGGEVLAEVL